MSDSAIHYLNEGIKVAEKWGSSPSSTFSKHRKVMVYSYAAETDKMTAYGTSIIEELRKTNDRETELELLKNIAKGFFYKQEFSNGINYAIEAVNIAEELNDEMSTFSAQRVLTHFLMESDRIAEAKKIASQLLLWAKGRERTVANNVLLSNAFYLNGAVYSESGELDEALYFFREAKDHLKKHSGNQKFSIERSILQVLLKQNDSESIRKQYDYIQSTYNENFTWSPKFLFLKGKVLQLEGKDIEAISIYDSLIGLGKNISDQMRYESRINLTEIYENQGKYRLALENKNEALKLNIEMNKAEEELKLEKLQSQYELSQKESEIQQLDIERLEQKNILEANENALETRRLYIIFLLVLLILLAVIVLSISRRAKDALVRKELQRNSLEKERQIERLKAQESERAIELKNQLFANISHEFRTPLTLILSLIHI